MATDNYHSRIKKAAYAGKLALTSTLISALGYTAYLSTGCANISATPRLRITACDEHRIEGQAGLELKLADNKANAGRDGPNKKRGFFTRLADPFILYRSAEDSENRNGKLFPYWREHPWITSGKFVLYAAPFVMNSLFKGSGSDDESQSGDMTTTTTTTTGRGSTTTIPPGTTTTIPPIPTTTTTTIPPTPIDPIDGGETDSGPGAE